jgi:hypothetical protein
VQIKGAKPTDAKSNVQTQHARKLISVQSHASDTGMLLPPAHAALTARAKPGKKKPRQGIPAGVSVRVGTG